MNKSYYRVKAIGELPILVPVVFEIFHVLLKLEVGGGRRQESHNP